MNAEDVVIMKEMTSKRKRGERTSSKPDRKKEARSTGLIADKKKNLLDQRSRFTNFTSLVMPIEHVMMQIKDEPFLQWPRPIYAPAEVRDKSKY